MSLPFESSTEQAQPVELYRFVGTHRTYLLTSDAVPHTYGGLTYLPAAGLQRSNIKVSSQDGSDDEITVSIPIEQLIVQENAFQVTPPKLDLIMYRKQRDTDAGEVAWRGPVSLISVDGGLAQFKCPSILSVILTADVPNVAFQPMCNHVLFDRRCGISRNANRVVTTVAQLYSDPRLIRLTSRGSFAANWFKNGELVNTATGERRSIVDESGSTSVIVNYEFSKLAVGSPVELVSGCDHGWFSDQGCPKYNNHTRFGATPFMPGNNQNVFITGVAHTG